MIRARWSMHRLHRGRPPRVTRTPRGALLLLIAVGAIAAAILVAPGKATHGEAEYHCNDIYGGATNNLTHWGGFNFTWLAVWNNVGQNQLDYISRRQDSGYNPTYTQWNPGGAYDYVVTSGYVDMYRRTGVQRAGYAFDAIGADDYSGHGC
jgi:hypothetical protein